MSYDFTVDPKRYMNDVEGAYAKVADTTDPELDSNPVIRFLTESLKRANVSDHETRGALSEMQAKADAITREREAIERAIKAYQTPPNVPMRGESR